MEKDTDMMKGGRDGETLSVTAAEIPILNIIQLRDSTVEAPGVALIEELHNTHATQNRRENMNVQLPDPTVDR